MTRYHIHLTSQAPGAEPWDVWIEADSEAEAVELAEQHAGESAGGWPAVGAVCSGCPECRTGRAARTYLVSMRDESGSAEKVSIQIYPGTEPEQDAAAVSAAEQAIRDWVRDGDWGQDGAIVAVQYVLSDGEYVWPEESVEVEIEPDHAALIRAAAGEPQRESCGDDPDDHDWTGEGEGGCSENPGVFGHGGTTISYSTHCRRCGLHRCETELGVQHNPGEHDTVEYRWLSDDEIAAHVRDDEMDDLAN